MFTGIVTDVGKVKRVEKRGDTHIVIATQYDVSGIDIGASIACSGICLTVTDKGRGEDRWFAVVRLGRDRGEDHDRQVEGGPDREP